MRGSRCSALLHYRGGVYGWLAEIALPRASALVWLDPHWDLCRASLILRGQRLGAKETDFTHLRTWAGAYWDCQSSSSLAGCSRLFENFAGARWKLHNRKRERELLVRLADCA